MKRGKAKADIELRRRIIIAKIYSVKPFIHVKSMKDKHLDGIGKFVVVSFEAVAKPIFFGGLDLLAKCNQAGV